MSLSSSPPTFLLPLASKLLERITQKHLKPTLPAAVGHICAPHLFHLLFPPQPPASFFRGEGPHFLPRSFLWAAFLSSLPVVSLESLPRSLRAHAAAPPGAVQFSPAVFDAAVVCILCSFPVASATLSPAAFPSSFLSVPAQAPWRNVPLPHSE